MCLAPWPTDGCARDVSDQWQVRHVWAEPRPEWRWDGPLRLGLPIEMLGVTKPTRHSYFGGHGGVCRRKKADCLRVTLALTLFLAGSPFEHEKDGDVNERQMAERGTHKRDLFPRRFLPCSLLLRVDHHCQCVSSLTGFLQTFGRYKTLFASCYDSRAFLTSAERTQPNTNPERCGDPRHRETFAATPSRRKLSLCLLPAQTTSSAEARPLCHRHHAQTPLSPSLRSWCGCRMPCGGPCLHSCRRNAGCWQVM